LGTVCQCVPTVRRATLCLCLSCPTSRSPLHLHSFPTRRSSDLLLETGIPAEKVVGRIAAWFPHDCPRNGADIGAGNLVTEKAIRDRKSTRLNSSHVKISYAVFCLKKKKYKAIKYVQERRLI